MFDPGVPPERTICPGCGTHVHPAEKKVGGIAYFNCRRCDFSTWEWTDYLVRERAPKSRVELMLERELVEGEGIWKEAKPAPQEVA